MQKLKNGKITILFRQDGLKIEVEDGGSSVRFVDITLTQEQLCRALSREACVPCDITLSGLDKIGKTLQHRKFVFELPPDTNYSNKKEKAQEQIKLKCPEGWEPDIYFNSQDSFFTKDDKEYARTTIRQWV